MTDPNRHNKTNSFQPPQWIRDAARNAAKASGIDKDAAVASRIRDAKEQADSKQHQDMMRVLTNKMQELRPRVVVGPADTREPAKLNPTPKEIMRVSEDKRKSSGRHKKKIKARVERTKQPATKTVKDLKAMETDVTPLNTIPEFENEAEEQKYITQPILPEWYISITTNNITMKSLDKRRPPALTSLQALKALIHQCETETTRKPSDYDKLRDAVHEAEIALEVTPHILRRANMLLPQAGLPRIFSPSANFPPDLKADSYQLYRRWYKGNLKQDLLRGIITKKSNNRSSDRIDPDYRARFPCTAKFTGQGDLVPGQWWPTQLCAVRDGAHGAPQGGICGSKSTGAFSIVLSSGPYDDTDSGNIIWYSGTPGANGVATENTKHLLTSYTLRNPIRVIRSAQLPRSNPYRPQKGLRYDGLYTVTQHEQRDVETAMYRFCLERCPGQMPIRFEGKAARPSKYEISEYERLKEKGAWNGDGEC